MTPAEPTKTWDSKAITHPRQLLAGKCSPCGQFVLAGDFDGHIQRWAIKDDPTASDEKTTLTHHQTWVQALAFHPDGKRMFSADFWGNIAAWNYADEKPRPIWALSDAHQNWIRTAIVTRDGQFLVTAGNDLAIRLWDVANGRLVKTLTGHQSHIYTLAQHPSGELLSGDQQGNVKQWNIATGRLTREMDAKSLYMTPEASTSLTGIGGVRSIGFNADASIVYFGGLCDSKSAGFAEGKPRLLSFKWADGKEDKQLKFKEPFEGFVVQIFWHPEGFLVGAGGGVGGQIWFWKPGEEEPFHTVKPIKHIRELSMHPDGKRLITICFEPRGQGGNGRRNMTQEEYVENIGAVRIFSMTQKPAPMRPMPARPAAR